MVIADMSVSLDGFVADAAGGVDEVFAWYGKPQSANPEGSQGGLGVIVYGRRTFEQANGWGGQHPVGAPVIVVTHAVPDGWPRPGSSVAFATDGIEQAMAQAAEMAGERVIALGCMWGYLVLSVVLLVVKAAKLAGA
jgi:dihydrofolate reductase